MLSKIRFALTHPLLVWRFVQRELRRRYRKATSGPTHLPRPRSGAVCSTGLFGSANFSDFSKKEADRILKGELCLYGLREFSVGKKADWHTDYLSGFQWPRDTFASDITYSYPVGTDIKNPWELSRAHHLVTMAGAYRATGDERYASYMVDTISDWIKENPFYLGVNWKVAMEVGIRSVNWLVAYDLISASPKVTKEFTRLFLGSLAEHGQFIMENLEYFGVRSNHYMSDLVGLVWIGSLCPSLPGARTWERFGRSELEKEILHQFHPDGLNFEASIAYHRLVLELVGYTGLLAQRLGRPLDGPVQDRLRAAFQATATILTPAGRGPQFGDNDTGRTLIFSHYHEWQAMDLAYLLDLGALLFPELPTVGSDELGWLLGTKASKRNVEPFAHLASGHLVARQGDWQLNLQLAGIGQDGNGGHNHDDAGSFELSFGAESIVVDPGTGCYTSNPEVRNRFRSALSHNAPVAKGLAHQPPSLLFVGDRFTVATLAEQSETQWTISLEAERYSARRTLALSPDGLTVTDSIAGKEVRTLLTFPPELKLTATKDGFSLGKNLKVVAEGAEIVPAEYSPAYATILPTSGLLLTGSDRVSFTISRI